ncbi:MAG: hypothetical protein ACR2OF_08210, partial [Hyphomicrobium sp.]
LMPSHAQQAGEWSTGVELRGALPPLSGDDAEPPPDNSLPTNTTVIPRTPSDPKAQPGTESGVELIALLTADGQRIDNGIVWRIYDGANKRNERSNLIKTVSTASPVVKLVPGEYLVNAAFGRAHLTRRITVKRGATTTEQFVLNAGGLRVKALVEGAAPMPNSVVYDIYSDERDQFGKRFRIISRAKTDVITRLNAGIYHIVSTYGDANAMVEADVTVEAGKLTEATVAHAAAYVTFKLVMREGGEALPDTQWIVQTTEGQVVKRSVGALPTHILAPGTYTIIARSGERAFKRDFTLASGDIAQVEVLMQ